jgi:sporulation protein YlmC with PRC-barrel domain
MKRVETWFAPLIASVLVLSPLVVGAQYKSDSSTPPSATQGPAPSSAPSAEPGPTPKAPAMSPAPSLLPSASDKPSREWELSHRASKIIGTDVRNTKGEKIGDVKDIVLDGHGGVAYAVISTGGFLGIGDQMHAVPWKVLQLNVSGKDYYILNVDKASLSKVPGFSSKSWPNFADDRWESENRKYFPVQ